MCVYVCVCVCVYFIYIIFYFLFVFGYILFIYYYFVLRVAFRLSRHAMWPILVGSVASSVELYCLLIVEFLPYPSHSENFLP